MAYTPIITSISPSTGILYNNLLTISGTGLTAASATTYLYIDGTDYSSYLLTSASTSATFLAPYIGSDGKTDKQVQIKVSADASNSYPVNYRAATAFTYSSVTPSAIGKYGRDIKQDPYGNIYAAFAHDGGNERYIRSTDNGLTYQVVAQVTTPYSADDCFSFDFVTSGTDLYCLFSINESSTNSGRLYRIKNPHTVSDWTLSATLQLSASSSDQRFYKVKTLSNNTILVAAGYTTGNANIYRSTDYGTTFSAVSISGVSALETFASIEEMDSGKVLIGCGSSTGVDDYLLYSTDYGATFTKTSTLSSNIDTVSDIKYLGNGRVIVGASTSAAGRGSIFINDNYGISGTWNSITLSATYKSVRALGYQGNGIVWCGTGDDAGTADLWRSNDYGNSWYPVADTINAVYVGSILPKKDGNVSFITVFGTGSNAVRSLSMSYYPTITSISPSTNIEKGNIITVSGYEFVGPVTSATQTKLYIDGVDYSSNILTSAYTSATFTAPYIKGGTYNIQFKIAGNSYNDSLINFKSYSPVISSISPSTNIEYGNTITISGSNLTTSAVTSYLYIDGVNYTSNILTSASTSATFTAPLLVPGNHNIKFYVGSDSSNEYTVTYKNVTYIDWTPSTSTISGVSTGIYCQTRDVSGNAYFGIYNPSGTTCEIYRSKDSGITFEKVFSSTYKAKVVYNIKTVSIGTSALVYFTVGSDTGSARLYRMANPATVNNWSTSAQKLIDFAVWLWDVTTIPSLEVLDDNTILIGTGNDTNYARLYKSTNLGDTFSEITLPDRSTLETINCIKDLGNGKVLIGLGNTTDTDGYFYYSDDYCTTVTKISIDSDADNISCIEYLGNGRVLAGVDTGYGYLYKSDNYGVSGSWSRTLISSEFDKIQSLKYQGNDVVWLGTGSGTNDASVWRSIDKGDTWYKVSDITDFSFDSIGINGIQPYNDNIIATGLYSTKAYVGTITYIPSILSITPDTDIYSSQVLTISGTCLKDYESTSLFIDSTDYTSKIITSSVSAITFSFPDLSAGDHEVQVFVGSTGSNIYTVTSIETPFTVTFSNHYPSTSRTIINSTGTEYGSVHVSVFSYDSSETFRAHVSATPAYFELVNGSIGEIDTTSFVQTSDHQAEFNIINISARGDIVLSANNALWSSMLATDGTWYYSCSANRLINLTNFLPNHLYESTTYNFVKFFEDFLNTMYESSEDACNQGILKKIEKIRDFKDPSLIDIEYVNFFARKMGYSVDVTKSSIGLFTTSGNTSYENLTGSDLEEANKYIRFVLKNLPNWYKIKTTSDAVKIMLYSYGIVGDLVTFYTNDYNENWVVENENDSTIVSEEIPEDYYPTPHFGLSLNLRESELTWIDQTSEVIKAIDSIRPINTVLQGIDGYYIEDPQEMDVTIGIQKSVYTYINWEGPAATL